MTRSKKYTGLLLVGLLVILSSCNKYLNDNVNKSAITDDQQWTSEGNADIFLNTIYGYLSNEGNTPDPLDNFTDDNDGGYYWRSYQWKAGSVGPSVNNGAPMSEYAGSNQVDANDYASWIPQVGSVNGCYAKVRACNLFLQKTKQYSSNFSAAWVAKRTDEVRFLRAYFYSRLWQHVGGLVVLTQVLDNNTMTVDQLDQPRATFEETFNFLDNQLDTIVKNNMLKAKYNKGEADAGRATIGAALCLKGWIELFAASPAFNSGVSPTGVSDPKNLIHFATPDPARWAKAAATFQQFMTTYATTYDLYPQLDQLWYEANEYNKEIIWDKNLVANQVGKNGSNYEQYGGPVYILNNYYTWGNYDPTQELVDAFRMANGKDITDPTSGYDPQKPYVGREQRFYQFIVYDGAPYFLPWMTKTDTIYTRIDKVNPSKNEIDFGQTDVSNTAYYSKKRLNPTAPPGGAFASGQNFVYMRYVEIVLGYAEARNESAGPDATVYAAINKVRARSNTPALPVGLSQDQMRTQIRNERRVELCYENKRWYDMQRWLIAKSLLNVDRHAMRITNTVPSNNSGTWVYTPVFLNHPHVFTDNMYMNPIPQQVIDQNPKVMQNPGY